MKRFVWVGALVLCSSATASAFDSRCRVSGGADCDPGPAAARHRWNASDSEHNKLWDQSVSGMGLPSHLTSLVRLNVPTDSEVVGGFDTVQPKPWVQTQALAEREYQISEMAQLPDLSYSLWDWALGNEYCPIGNDPIGPCHRFASHMGTLNANHFLPLAESFYQYYHKLAMDRAAVCAGMRNALGTQFPAFAEQCDQQAFTLEAIGHHFLQDAWSMGHMWPRWGGTNPSDFGGASWRERALVVALTAGLIHGSKGVLQEFIESLDLGDSWWKFSITHPDVRDAMCAPINPQEFSCDTSRFLCVAPDFWSTLEAPSYFDPVDSKIKRGIGDLYAAEFATSPTYGDPYKRMMECARASIAELAQAAGLPATATGPAPSSSEFRSRCFDHQATNGSLWLGAGIDFVIDKAKLDAISVDFPIIGKVEVMGAKEATIYVRVPLTPVVGAKSVPKLLKPLLNRIGIAELGLSEKVISLSEEKGELTLPESIKAETRRDMAMVADFLEDRARANPNGIDAQANLPPMLGVARSSDPKFKHSKPADYVDVDKPYTPSVGAAASQVGDDNRQNAVARAYHRAFATEWCKVTKVSDLELLKTEEGGPRCEVCAEFASRHIRIGNDVSDYDNNNLPVCDYLGGSEFIYFPVEDTTDLSWEDVGRQWCGCADKPQTTCTGRAEGRIVDANTGEPIPDAIAFFNSTTASGSVTSEADGTYFSDKLVCETYTVSISALGYMTAEMTFTIEEDGSEVQLIELQAIDESCAATGSSVVGSVVDAATGEFVAGATVELREGADAPSSALVLEEATTDNNGVYAFSDLAGGYYTVNVARSGYQPSGAHSTPTCGTELLQRDIALVPTQQRALSFVLTWARPNDLDFHLLLPTGDEVSFGECVGNIDAEPFAQLDVDHRMADGPEAISVSEFLPGTYTLYVHNFSAQNEGAESFQTSQAEVLVYQDSEPYMRVVVPTSGDGFFWDVLSFEGTGQSFEIHELGVLRNDRSNPLAEEYVGTCTPGGPQ